VQTASTTNRLTPNDDPNNGCEFESETSPKS